MVATLSNAVEEAAAAEPLSVSDQAALVAQLRQISELQRHLLPRELPQPSGWRIAVYQTPGAWPSGDYYDVLSLPDGRLVLVMADASGHGGVPAVMMALARVTLHVCPLTSGVDRQPFCPIQAMVQPPHMALGHLNRVLHENSLEGHFMTAFDAILNPHTGSLQFANAGHLPPRWWHNHDRIVESLANPSGLPLGLLPDTTYALERIEMGSGDALILFTDGLTEAQNAAGKLFGTKRLDAALRESSQRGADGIRAGLLDRLDVFLGGCLPHDDLTFLVLERVAE